MPPPHAIFPVSSTVRVRLTQKVDLFLDEKSPPEFRKDHVDCQASVLDVP
jgi:hypothetical protein